MTTTWPVRSSGPSKTTAPRKSSSAPSIPLPSTGISSAITVWPPVKEIHIFDADEFLQHNAFRAPGAPSIEMLRTKPRKLAYLKAIYSNMRHGIIEHAAYITKENVGELRDMTFVF